MNKVPPAIFSPKPIEIVLLLDLELFLNIFSALPNGFFNDQGLSIYWNDVELITEPYNKIEKHYYCGKDLLQFPECKGRMYTILCVDLSDAILCDIYSDGEVVKLFSEESTVPKKQGQGGQSQPRFQATRDNEIVYWFKKINQLLMQYDREIILSIQYHHLNRFMSYMHEYNRVKIVRDIRGEYSGLAGVYDCLNRLEGEKQKKKST